MYHFLRQNPLLKPVFFILIGVHCAYSGLDIELCLCGLIFLLLHWVFRKYISTRIHFIWPLIFSLLGYAHAKFYRTEIPVEDTQEQVYQFEIDKLKKGNYLQVHGEFKSSSRTRPVYAILFIKGRIEIKTGHIYQAKLKFKYPNKPANPGTFDYKKHLEIKDIYLTAFTKSSTIEILGKSPHSSLKQISNSWQIRGSKIIQNYLTNPKAASIANALLLGDASDLSPETRESYALTGTMHILAVSGMHVGILFLLLQLLCKPIPIRWLRLLSGLAGLWVYAFITGLSPSVFRAVLMFSMLGIGKEIGRQSSIYNALAFSALILVISDPSTLFHIGFQLSFLSVLGIVIFTPLIESFIPCKNYFLRKIRTLFAVSVAAQLSTGILSLYYFHQFPTWFFISNILVVPLAAPIMLSGIGIILCSQIAPLAGLFAVICGFLIELSSGITQTISHWPFASIGPVYLSATSCILVYLILFASYVYFKKKLKIYLYSIFCLLIIFQSKSLWEEWGDKQIERLMVFSIREKSCLLIHQGYSLTLYSDRLTEMEYERQLEPYIETQKLSLTNKDSIHSSLIQLNKDNFLILKSSKEIEVFAHRDSMIAIIGKGQKIPRKEVLPSTLFCKIVLDSSCDYNTKKIWTQFAEDNSIPLHDVSLQGAFIYDLHGRAG